MITAVSEPAFARMPQISYLFATIKTLFFIRLYFEIMKQVGELFYMRDVIGSQNTLHVFFFNLV
jgi:hypothetical protein